MRAGFSLAVLVSFVASAVPTAALAEGPPAPFDFQYVLPVSASSGPIEILDATVQQFELALDPTSTRIPDAPIVYLEVEVTGFSHGAPWDVDIWLVPPFNLDAMILMGDQGDQVQIPQGAPVDLLFTDKADDPLPREFGVGLETGSWLPKVGTFDQYYNGPVFGTTPWTLLISDDDTNAGGQIESITLRGVVVPEPATLSLLALGAVAVAVRRRRS